jgi:hypothetical protein
MNKKEFIEAYLNTSDEVKAQILVLIENQPQHESPVLPLDTSYIDPRPR